MIKIKDFLTKIVVSISFLVGVLTLFAVILAGVHLFVYFFVSIVTLSFGSPTALLLDPSTTGIIDRFVLCFIAVLEIIALIWWFIDNGFSALWD